MKKYLIVLLSLFIVSALFGQTKKSNSNNNQKLVVTGYVVSKGNMPFVFPAIKADDGKEYLIITTEKQKRRLLDNQGKHLRFTLLQNEDSGWVVKKFKVIK